MTPRPAPALPRATLLAYALPWIVVQVVFLPLFNFVPGHYSDALGVPLAAVGAVLLGTRLIDVFTDPLIGLMSDRTRSRFGRRRPFVVAGIPVLAGGAWMLFAPPDQVGTAYLFAAVSLTFFGFTLIQVPYVAWGAELSKDYDERNRVVAWREGLGVVGTLIAVTSPLVAQGLGYQGLGAPMFGIAVGVLFLLPALMLPALTRVPEPPPEEATREPMRLGEGLRAVTRNREFLWFAAASFITFLGISPGAAMGWLMMKHTFDAESLYGFMVLGEFVGMLISIPFWAWFAGRIGKHRAIALGLAWMTLFTFPVPFLGYQDPWSVVAVTFVRGFGFGAVFVVPYSMFADVIDADTARTGKQRSGLYMALGGMNLKLALMFGTFLATVWPTLFGFEPSAETNTDAAKFQVAVSYAWITCFFQVIALPLYWFFPLTRERQEALRAAIRDAGAVSG